MRLSPRSSSISACACSLLVLLVIIAFRAVFPSTIGKLRLLGIMIGMDQLDSSSGGVIWAVEVVNAVKSHGHAVPRVSQLFAWISLLSQARASRQGEVHEKNDAPRRLKAPFLGMRLAPPSEVAGPLGPAVTVGYVAAGAHLLAVSSLRGADGVDDTAVKFLLRAELKKKEEEERKAEEEKHERRMLHRVGEGLPLTDAERTAWRKWATSSSSSAGKRRKRKKMRKRRLPRASFRPSRELWRRLPSSCACLPTSGTTSSVLSRVRRRVGLLVTVFLPTVWATGFCSTAPIPY